MIPITTPSNKAEFSSAQLSPHSSGTQQEEEHHSQIAKKPLWGATGGESRGEQTFQRALELVPGLVFHCSQGKH